MKVISDISINADLNVDNGVFFVDSTSNQVAIGTTSPDAYLHIYSSGSVVNQKFESLGVASWRIGIPNGQNYFAFDNSSDSLTSPKMAITSNGGLAVGTTTDENFKFNLNGKMQILGDTTTDGTMRIKSTKGTSQSHVHYGSTGDWYIRSADTSGKVIVQDSGGNLLVGTTTDNGLKLQVSGEIYSSQYVTADWGFQSMGVQGYTGNINIPTNPPITIEVIGGIITNWF